MVNEAVPESTAKGWVGDHMGSVRAASLLSFNDVQHLGLAYDAGRLGQRKDETLFIAAKDCETSVVGWLASQAFCLFTYAMRTGTEHGAAARGENLSDPA